MELEARDRTVQLAMKAQEHQQTMQHKAQMANIDAATAVHKQKIFSATEQAAVNQKLVQNHQQHQQKLQQTKELSSVQKRNSGTGKAKK
jgi:hypothetical protein